MNDFIGLVASTIAAHRLLPQGGKVIVALSGGADSVALLVALDELGYDCIAAHCDFHLRGDESERDRRYATEVAASRAAAYREIHFDVEAFKRHHGVSTEMACRDLRYDWFRELSAEYGGAPVAVAHHHDDNVETMLLNLLRGTGITGLAGMRYRNGIVIRPMLDCRRSDVERFLDSHGIPFMTDSTNLVSDVKRNKLRNIVLPMLRELFPDADKGLAATLGNLRDNAALYAVLTGEKSALYSSGGEINLTDMLARESHAPVLLYETLKTYGFNATHTADIIAAFNSDTASGKRFFSATHVAALDRGRLGISPRDNAENDCNDEIVIELTDASSLPSWLTAATVDACEFTPDRSGFTLWLDPTVLYGSPRFTLRHWREGDRLAPFGMKGTRLISDIFSDAKLSLEQKSATWLLTRDNTVLWIVGLRASRHFPVNPRSASPMLRLTARLPNTK